MGPRCLLWARIPVFPLYTNVYRFSLPARVRYFESAELDFSSLVYSSGASFSPRDGDLDGCTSSDGDSDDVVTFPFHTCLVRRLDFGRVGSSFTTSLGSSSFSHLFFGGRLLWCWDDRRLLLEQVFFGRS